jgi:hypothetical protein
MRLRKGRGQRSASRFSASGLAPILKIAGLVLAVAGLAALVIFVIVPLFGGGLEPEPTPTPTPAATPTPAPTPIARADMSDGAEELAITNKSVNDPFVFGREVVFSTGDATQVSPEINTIALFNMDTEQTEAVAEITRKYASLFEPKMNEDYIVYLDCKSEYGGAVCGYDREAKEMWVMREYLFGKPKVSLAGEYALWTQQTGKGTDKVYLYHLPTRETVVLEEFVNTPFSVSGSYMSEDAIVFVQPYGESQVVENSSASEDAEIRVIPLKQGGDLEHILFQPGMYAYEPMIEGDNIVFMNSPRDDKSSLMLCTKTGDTYAAPVVIAEGVLNYCLGDGFVAYTKDEAVYIYYFADASSGRLSPESRRALLSSATGKDVVWYDITDLQSANVAIHLQVP